MAVRLESPDTARTCHKLFFYDVPCKHLTLFPRLISFPSLKFASLMCVPACLQWFEGDYYLLEAEEVVWAQAGIAWQTEVAGVSLPSLKD